MVTSWNHLVVSFAKVWIYQSFIILKIEGCLPKSQSQLYLHTYICAFNLATQLEMNSQTLHPLYSTNSTLMQDPLPQYTYVSLVFITIFKQFHKHYMHYNQSNFDCTHVPLFLQLILKWIHKHCTHNNQLILDWTEVIQKFWIALFSYMIEPIG